MGLRPTQGDEERVLFRNHTQWKRVLPFVISTGAQRSGEICGVSGFSWKRQLSPLSSRPEESWAFGPPKAMKNGSCSATTVAGSALSPLSSRPEESWAFGPPMAMKNGSCSATTVAGSAVLPFVISTGGIMGLRPTQGDEERVLFSNHCCWKRRPPLCHLDRRNHGPPAHPRR